MTDVLPTFRDNRDRIVYLLAEYKIPLTLLFLAGGVWFVWATPQLPSIPAVYGWFALGFALISVPAWAVMLRIMRSLNGPDGYAIGIMDTGTNELYDAKRCPKALWHSKTVVGPTPLDPDGDGAFDFIVTKWNYYEDIGELEVRGAEREDMTPAEATETRERVDEYYQHHHELRRRYSKLKGQLQRKISEVHDMVVMQMMAQTEEAELAIDKSLADMIDEMENEIDELPDGPGNDNRSHVRKHHPHADDSLEIDPAGMPEAPQPVPSHVDAPGHDRADDPGGGVTMTDDSGGGQLEGLFTDGGGGSE